MLPCGPTYASVSWATRFERGYALPGRSDARFGKNSFTEPPT